MLKILEMIKKVATTTALLAVGLITSLGYSAVAQISQPVPSQNQSAQRPNSSPMSALDRQFVLDAAQGGMAEIRMGELALQRARNPEVKRFARQMIQDHTRVNTQLMQLASRMGVTVPTTVGPKYEAAMARLMQLSGPSFDEAYMNEAGVNAHLENTAVFQRQAALGQAPELQAFAVRTLPAVQGHLQMAASMTGYRFAQNSATPRNSNMPAMPGMTMPR